MMKKEQLKIPKHKHYKKVVEWDKSSLIFGMSFAIGILAAETFIQAIFNITQQRYDPHQSTTMLGLAIAFCVIGIILSRLDAKVWWE